MTTSDTRIADGWILYSLLALIAWLPIPLGSKFPLGYGIMEVGAFSLLSAWLLLQLFSRTNMRNVSRASLAVLSLFLASLGYQLVQAVPLPLEVVRALSPNAFEVYSFTRPETTQESFSISLDRGLSLQEFLKSAAYVAVFYLALILVTCRKRLQQLVDVLVIAGFAQALFGLVDASLGGTLFRIPFTGIEDSSYAATGTYTNYNHFAGLMEMAIPLAIGVAIGRARHEEPHTDWRVRLVALSTWLLSGRLWLHLCALSMITALLFSTSRGAAVSLVVAGGLTTGMAALSRGFRQRRGALAFLVFIPVAAGILLGANQLLTRLEAAGFQSDRHLHRELAYRVIADYPAFGIGSGNWSHVYPAYQTPQDPGTYAAIFVSHVHNDYLELLAEQGVIGFVLFGSAVLIALGTMINALRRRRDPLMRGVLYGCITATVSLLIHALVDFNFHIPANAAWFSVILAMGLIASRMPHDA